MITLVPTYYKLFTCIADKCAHTCCKGLEIDIDEETLDKYRSIPGKFGDKIRENLHFQDGVYHFTPSEEYPCPLLTKENLCSIILNLGDDFLCQPCKDHPRFRNYFDNHIEMGLGMVCEEATRIILTFDKPFSLEPLNKEDKLDFFLPEDEQYIIDYRKDLMNEVSIKYNSNKPLIRLYEYLIFRHLPDALYDDRLEERILYIIFLFKLIYNKWDKKSLNQLITICTNTSYDYEYDEEKKEELLNLFSKQIEKEGFHYEL